MNTNRLLTAIFAGAILGIITEYVIRPYIEDPIKEEVSQKV